MEELLPSCYWQAFFIFNLSQEKKTDCGNCCLFIYRHLAKLPNVFLLCVYGCMCNNPTEYSPFSLSPSLSIQNNVDVHTLNTHKHTHTHTHTHPHTHAFAPVGQLEESITNSNRCVCSPTFNVCVCVCIMSQLDQAPGEQDKAWFLIALSGQL